ncbi:uncharacterized protein LOC126552669, partial [Aphis gossypii]|uniref:uncharacterized protein LOC126552669 n=1 Tax=Aphis gossypii TaxID=80765 RepID=UPI00215927EB
NKRSSFYKTSKRSVVPQINLGPDENYGNVSYDPLLELTECEIENYKRTYLEKLSLSEYQVKTLEIRTKRQNQCEEWYIERKKRLTASIFGKICKLREKTSRVKTVNDILFGTFTGNAATRYGIANEVVAKEQLEERLKKKILPSGLIVDIKLPFLAASPDGIIEDDSLVEIKCPASAKEFSPEEAITIGKIKNCLVNNGQLQLKRNDNYYYQVQGQLHISRRMYCYFCVWTPKGLLYEKIQRDDEFWENNMKLKLELFYLNYLLPSLIKEELIMTNK